MKYILFSALIILSGCQGTLLSHNNTDETYLPPEHVANTAEINQALLADLGANESADKSIAVIHPVDDVDSSLTKSALKDKSLLNSNDVWQRIRGQLTFDIPQNKRVIMQRNWYAKHPSYLTRVAKRAEPFLYYIVEELEKNNVPVELALLPVVESAFDPFAYSHGRASGMWQFVPATGTRFHMKQNWWYDGRRDIIASTSGAIQYMKYLHKFFDGDWLLALAAYNSGEGRVQRAVRKNKRLGRKTDFWSLDLPKETRAYVPKLLALADIVKRPEQFSLKLYEIANKEVIVQVDIKSQLDLAKAANLADLSLPELQRLNPGFNRWSTDPDGPHRLLIPKDKATHFKQGLAKLSKDERLAWQRYKITNGDSLGQIAKKFHTSIKLIQQVNGIHSNQIRTGKYLLIPVAAKSLDSYSLSQEQRIAKKQAKPQQGIKITHRVVSGDNLWDIGQHYKVVSSKIAKWNGFAPSDPLKLGQKLVIWQKNTVSHKASYRSVEQAIIRNITYKVRQGDSFARIADKFNVRIRDIERWNSLNRKKYLQPGQRLKLSVDVTNNI